MLIACDSIILNPKSIIIFFLGLLMLRKFDKYFYNINKCNKKIASNGIKHQLNPQSI